MELNNTVSSIFGTIYLLFGSLFRLIMKIDFLRKFNEKHRLDEDLYLIPGEAVRLVEHIFHCYTGRVSMWYYIESSVRKYPRKIALVYTRPKPGKSVQDGDDMFEVERYTYADLHDIVLRLSYILVNEYNVRPKQTIVLDFMNKPLMIFLWFAVWNIGATPSFLNYNVVNNPLVHCLKVVGADQVFIDENDVGETFNTTLEQIEKELPQLKLTRVIEEKWMALALDKSLPKFRGSDEDRDIKNAHDYDPAIMLYTSGTTGLPKSAIMSWRKLFFASRFFSYAVRINKNSSVYTAMPLYHGTAAILGVLPLLVNGGTICLGHKFSLSTYWTQVKLSGANGIQYVGEVCRYLLNAPPLKDEANNKVTFAYGNGLRPDVWVEFKKRFGINAIGEFYSSTESPFATTNYQVGDKGIGAIRNGGTLLRFVLSFEYDLVKMDPEDDNEIYRNPKTGLCEKPKPNEKGEILMKILNPKKPKHSFPGYVNNEEATNKMFVRDVFRKGDCWVRGGDLLKFDELGYLYFVDRLGDTYRWKSENVSTTEVENEISTVADVTQCVTVGVKVPNHEGKAGYSIIETNDEKINNSQIPTEALLNEISKNVVDNLPHFARPIFIRFESLINTDNHKIKKKAYTNPVLPRGEYNNWNVYYLNQKSKKYEVLTDEVYDGIVSGKVRL